jgi:hypothetical protein
VSPQPNPNRDALVDALQAVGYPEADYHLVDAIIEHLYDNGAGWDLTRAFLSDGEFPYPGRLIRAEDETGVSGTGVVGWVAEFPDGVAVTRWAVTDIRQTCVWNSIDDVLAIHGHGGKTRIEWR